MVQYDDMIYGPDECSQSIMLLENLKPVVVAWWLEALDHRALGHGFDIGLVDPIWPK